VLLQLAALPQVPAANGVVQAPCPEPSAIVRYVDATRPIRVALELPGEREGLDVHPGVRLLQHPTPQHTGPTHLTMVWFCRSHTTMLPSLQQEKQTLASGLTARA
jgi:hypothetical protein